MISGLFCSTGFAQFKPYTPAQSNLEARNWFQDNKFGMFIHWGLYSILGDGEWVMNQQNIPIKDYDKLEGFFNPVAFNAHDWVARAKAAGMTYITLVTRHHDGFSMWDTKYSDFNIMHTPYHQDIVKEIADECHKQGLKIFFYYSLLDWRRSDYSYWTGRTGKGTGRTEKGNWQDYIQFMKNQLTELLTHYGKVSGIWFDGYWDQMPEESKDRKDTTFVDWHIQELYTLIHQLQPDCLVGNNHHMTPIPGEDFQMFERDIPGQNAHGLSFQKVSPLPLETCATLNDSWGFTLKDDHYKTLAEFVRLLSGAACSNANLLMNIGPMPNGLFSEPFNQALDSMGTWIKTYGQSIYGTRGGYIGLQKWGGITQKAGKVFLHVLHTEPSPVTLADFPHKKIRSAYLLKDKTPVSVQLNNGTLSFHTPPVSAADPDAVIVLEVE
jgi:alpha-L-fucosidase